jgi:lycopene cyclase domain-containing protein
VLKFGYVAMLAFTVMGSFWLEVIFKVAVLKRVKRVVLTIAPVAAIFLVWDLYAVHFRHWNFDKKQILGIYLPGQIPIEEFLFFVIVPLAAIMTIEAVRRVKSNWAVGDER